VSTDLDGLSRSVDDIYDELDRVRAQRDEALTERNTLLAGDAESSQIIAELSTALAALVSEPLRPCLPPCAGHLGPRGNEALRGALKRWDDLTAQRDELLAALERMVYRINCDGRSLDVFPVGDEDLRNAREVIARARQATPPATPPVPSPASPPAAPLAPQHAELLSAAATVVDGFEMGVFERSTEHDHKPGWWQRLVPYIAAMATLQRAVDAVPTPPAPALDSVERPGYGPRCSVCGLYISPGDAGSQRVCQCSPLPADPVHEVRDDCAPGVEPPQHDVLYPFDSEGR
jgi:hypothetical protein